MSESAPVKVEVTKFAESPWMKLYITIAGIILVGLQLYQTSLASRNIEKTNSAIVAIDDTKQKVIQTEKKADKAIIRAEETHDLVNSEKGVALDLRVVELTRLYKITNDSDDLLELNQAKITTKAHKEAMNKIVKDRLLNKNEITNHNGQVIVK